MLAHEEGEELARLRARVRQLEERLALIERWTIGTISTARDLLLDHAERQAKVGSWTWDLRSGEVVWSPELFRILGCDPARDRASAEGYFGAIHPQDRERVRQLSAEAVRTGIADTMECRLLLPDGTVREIVTDGVPVFEGPDLVRFVGTVHDVTDGRAAVRALARSELLLNQAQRVAHVGSWYRDQITQTVEWSDEFYRIFGLTREERPRSRDFFALVIDEDRERLRAEARRAATTGINVTTEFRIRRKSDGALRHCHCHAQSIRDDREQPVAFLGTVFDVTERMELEAQLGHAQKMEALGRLAGGIAHEFNNLLTVMLGHAQLLNPDNAREERRAIIQAAEGAAELTRNLLSFSRQVVRAAVAMDVDDAVAAVGKLVTRVIGERVQLITDRGVGPHRVRADPGQIQQVLLNLAINAKDAMPDGGILRMGTAAQLLDAERAGRIPNARPGNYVVVEVSDTGVGMDERTKRRIFEPFFTTKPAGKGTGLGLAIVYGAVRQNGGAIEVESEPGRGTTFRIYLPADAETTPTPEVVRPPAAPRGVGTVLVVEDDVEVGTLIASILEDAGYSVYVAHDACRADELWAGHGASVDLLITDVVMPERGGPQTARLFRTQRPPLRVLFISGYAPEESGEVAPHDWLEKPFSPEALLARVRAALE